MALRGHVKAGGSPLAGLAWFHHEEFASIGVH